MNILAAADEYAARQAVRRCALCHDAGNEVREAALRLRQRGMSSRRIADFLKQTAESHGHGIAPSQASVENHFNRHVDWRAEDGGEKNQPRRRR